jgi:hypothetical protein
VIAGLRVEILIDLLVCVDQREIVEIREFRFAKDKSLRLAGFVKLSHALVLVHPALLRAGTRVVIATATK